jgi:hypothetical protein
MVGEVGLGVVGIEVVGWSMEDDGYGEMNLPAPMVSDPP